MVTLNDNNQQLTRFPHILEPRFPLPPLRVPPLLFVLQATNRFKPNVAG